MELPGDEKETKLKYVEPARLRPQRQPLVFTARRQSFDPDKFVTFLGVCVMTKRTFEQRIKYIQLIWEAMITTGDILYKVEITCLDVIS